MAKRHRLLIASLSALLTAYASAAHAEPHTVTGVLRHSAVAALDEDGRIDVHTTDNDEIAFRLENVEADTAVFNGTYELLLIKRDAHAYYYLQPSSGGLVLWVYFPEAQTVTYAKLRAFPLDGLPSSYLMIARARRTRG